VTNGLATIDRGRIAWLAAGAIAIVGGTALGWNAALLDAVVGPPVIVRAALVAASAVVGIALLRAAIGRLSEAPRVVAAQLTGRDVAALIRAVRLVFLAVAAFAAGAGWLLGHPLPFVVALVIAGIDILETSLLLLVVAVRRPG
jgi:hypothetical protein